MSVLSVYVYLYLAHVVSEVRRRQHIPWNWSNRQLCGITWVLGTKPQVSARATGGVKRGAVSPPLLPLFLQAVSLRCYISWLWLNEHQHRPFVQAK